MATIKKQKTDTEKFLASKEEIKKLKAALKVTEDIINRREKEIERLSQKINEILLSVEHAEAYATHSQFQELKSQRDNYMQLYEVEKQARAADRDFYIAKLQERNSRGAGRKPIAADKRESVQKLKNERPELSIRQIAKQMGMSPTTVSNILNTERQSH